MLRLVILRSVCGRIGLRRLMRRLLCLVMLLGIR